MSEDPDVDCANRERVAMAGPGANGGKAYSNPRLLEVLLRRA
ncbi:MAG: hypothetical protein U1F65_06990 [Verrucomicrobiota bacterium]